MTTSLRVAAIVEVVTGAALLLTPGLVVQLLAAGAPSDPLGIVIARLAGVALISLSVACLWASPLAGMLTYNLLATVLLALAGFQGAFSGVLLWPAVAFHAGMTVLLARAFRLSRQG